MKGSVVRAVVLPLLAVVLLAWPVGAAEAFRTWRDESGKFEVRAKFVDGDDGKVRLEKEDGKEITVPLARLCAADRAHAIRLIAALHGDDEPATDPVDEPTDAPAVKSEAPVRLRDFPPPRAASRVTKGPMAVPARLAEAKEPVGGFVADPGPVLGSPAAPAGIEIGVEDEVRHVSRVVPVDPQGVRCLVGVLRGPRYGKTEGSRIFLVDPAAGTATVVFEGTEHYDLLDHDIATGTTLLGERATKLGGLILAQRPTRLLLATGLAEGKPNIGAVRESPVKDRASVEIFDARLLSSRHAMVTFPDSAGVWDLESGRSLEAFGAAGLAVASPGGRYVAIPEGKRVVVTEPATRRTISAVHTAWAVNGMAFDPAGKELVILEPGWITVVDLVAGGEPRRFQTPEWRGPLRFVGPSLVITGAGALVDLERKAVLWEYRLPIDSGADGTEWSVVGSTMICRDGHRLLFLPVPHAAAEARRQSWQEVADPILLRPGDGVRIAVEASEGVQLDRGPFEQALAGLAQKAGWRVTADAPVTLVARFDRLDSRPTRVLDLSRAGPTNSTFEAHPLVASLEVRSPTGVAWSENVVHSSLPVVRQQPNESVEQAIRRLETPSVAPFAALTLPPTIERAEVLAGRGSSLADGAGWKDAPAGETASRHDRIVNADRALREAVANTERVRREALETIAKGRVRTPPVAPVPGPTVGREEVEGRERLVALVLGVAAVAFAAIVAMIAGMWKIFTKAGRPGIQSCIPVYGQASLFDIAGLPPWLVVIMFGPQLIRLVMLFAGQSRTPTELVLVSLSHLVNLALFASVDYGLARNFGKGVGFAAGLFFLPFVFYPILGFGKARYRPR